MNFQLFNVTNGLCFVAKRLHWAKAPATKLLPLINMRIGDRTDALIYVLQTLCNTTKANVIRAFVLAHRHYPHNPQRKWQLAIELLILHRDRREWLDYLAALMPYLRARPTGGA